MLVFVCRVNIMYVCGQNQFCVKRRTCPVSVILLSRRSVSSQTVPGLCMLNRKPSEQIYVMCVSEGLLCVHISVCTIT